MVEIRVSVRVILDMLQRETYLSGDTLGNVLPFSGFAWMRREAARTNWPTVDAKLQVRKKIKVGGQSITLVSAHVV